jgi:uncharacterized repeat protein (TIGR02543 family)
LSAAANAQTVPIQITTQYSGLNIEIDGQYYSQPKQMNWAPGTQHTIAVPSPQYNCGGKYTFTGWSNGGPIRQTITAPATPATYQARFSVEYHMAPEVSPAAGGTVTRSINAPEDYYPGGSTVTLTAVPASGYVFAGWSGDYSGATNPLVVTITSFRRIAAVFAPAGVPAVTLTTNPPGLVLNVDGASVTAPAHFHWTPGSEHVINAPSPQPVDAGMRYVFDTWADSGGHSRTIVTPLTPAVYTASFSAQVPLTLTAAPLQGGSVQATPAIQDGWAPQFASVRLVAVPAAGYRFDGWTGAATSRESAITLTMEASRSVTANFAPSAGCAPQFHRAAMTAAASGDLLPVAVQAGAGCAWPATSDAPWLTFPSGAAGAGNGTLRLSVHANPGASARTANVQIGGAALRVTQPGAFCDFALAGQTVTVPASGGVWSLLVNGGAACQWSAAPGAGWITAAPAQGQGGEALTYTAGSNSGGIRSASISIGGQTLHILQKGATAATPAFQDVPASDPFFDHIQLLNLSIAGAGCSPTSFCPGAATTRAQMAEWVVRALLGETFPFPAAPYFNDVPATHPQFRFVQKLRELGITSGCDTARYCPGDSVTRGQMAAFLVRARLGLTAAESFPSPAAAMFADVPGTHLFFPYVQKLKQLGVTGGCTATTYCPDEITTRGQMAVFLIRAFFTP